MALSAAVASNFISETPCFVHSFDGEWAPHGDDDDDEQHRRPGRHRGILAFTGAQLTFGS